MALRVVPLAVVDPVVVLLDSAWPDRTIHVVAPSDGGADWLAAARRCVAVLDLLRGRAATAVIDLVSDRWSEVSGSDRGDQAVPTVSPYDLIDQQSWAEQDLEAAALLRAEGRWPRAVVVDVRDDHLWALARTYSTAGLGVRLLDADRAVLAVLEDAGAVITAALSDEEVSTLAALAPSATIAPLDAPARQRCAELLAHQAELRGRGRPALAQHQRAQDAERRRTEESWAELERPSTPPHPAADLRVEVSVTTHTLPGRPSATAAVQLRSMRLGALRRHDSADGPVTGTFPLLVHGLSAGSWPEGGHVLPCYVHAPSQRIVGRHAVLVADLPGRDAVPDSGRPPLFDGWGTWIPWSGWSVWVERAAEDSLVLTAPVSWQHVVEGALDVDPVVPVPDAVIEVTITLRLTQQDATAPRGRTGDPLSAPRRVLRTGADPYP